LTTLVATATTFRDLGVLNAADTDRQSPLGLFAEEPTPKALYLARGSTMGWLIKCPTCRNEARASNIVDLLTNHRDEDGWFLCSRGHHGYIEKSFALQEAGDRWEPFLRGAIPLGTSDRTYQPFVFLVSYEPTGEVTDVWFSYYKDLRDTGGRLKLGYGPGGPPVLGATDVLKLVRRMLALGCISTDDIRAALEDDGTA
jgi:hypothetical protein